MQRTYLERILDNALLLEDGWDFVVVHDPQPAALLHFLRDNPSFSSGRTRWIWRCHIDLTVANPTVWEFFRPFVELHDASVWTMSEFVRRRSRWTALSTSHHASTRCRSRISTSPSRSASS